MVRAAEAPWGGSRSIRVVAHLWQSIWAQHARQHVLAAEHVQRQAAAAVVVGVEVRAFLCAMQRHVRCMVTAMDEFTKAKRRQLRELAGQVYEAEAHRMLEKLDAEFPRWREGEILSSDLLSAIHEFHQHASRELWSMYQSLHAPQVVGRGMALGLIPAETVPEPLRARLQSHIAFFSDDRA